MNSFLKVLLTTDVISHEQFGKHEQSEQMRLLLDSTNAAICGIDLSGRCISANQAFKSILGYADSAAFLGRNLHALIHSRLPDGTPLAEDECLLHKPDKRGDALHIENDVLWRADGTAFPVEYWSRPVFCDRGLTGAVVTFLDITVRKQAESRMQRLAYFDALTDLPNRVLFHDRMQQALAQAKRHHRMLALHYFDLDHFKETNDTFGHNAGDRLLQLVAERLRHSVRAGDTVARLGGDEFVILQTDLGHVEGAATLAARLMQSMSEPFVVNDLPLRATASMGIAVYPLDDSTGSQLLQHADAAMYLAKNKGRNNIQLFAAALNSSL